MRTPLRALLLATLLPCAAQAQDPAPVVPLDPLPAGRMRVLKALVIAVQGTVQARTVPEGAWKPLSVDDVLRPGALVRTGRESTVTLRVGPNATLLVDRHTRVAIPEIVLAGGVLRTRVTLAFGRADVRVDRIGLENDFEVKTPTATLAVRGTAWRVWWDAVAGFRAQGVKGNRLHAIEVRYLEGARARLSGADRTSEAHPLPALEGYYLTYLAPLPGAVGRSEVAEEGQSQEWRSDPARATGVEAARSERGRVEREQADSPQDPVDVPPVGGPPQ